jgi:hypothetical protein
MEKVKFMPAQRLANGSGIIRFNGFRAANWSIDSYLQAATGSPISSGEV